MDYGLPKSVDINGEEFAIRYDYRVVLDIFEALNDPELDDHDRALAILQMFYVEFDALTDYQEAIQKCFWFINGGQNENDSDKRPKLVDWEQDFRIVVSPVNRVLGYEVRSVDYNLSENTGGVHWWTFLSAYQEIGDCLFAQVVGIRQKQAQGKKLDKSEREFYRKNKGLVDLKTRYTKAEDELVKIWTGG